MSGHAISVAGLTVHRNQTRAVDDASFTVDIGQVVALVGPNGAGKTTIAETIEGYLQPTSGSVRVFDLSPTTDRSTLAARWGVMPQQGGLPMGLTVVETIELFAALHDSPADVGELLELTGLTSLADRRWRRLSGGEQQRLSLAIALCGGDDLLILDEPTAAVDPDGRARILALITERAKAGSTVLMTTHRFDDVEQVADHVIMMDRGRIVADESLSSLTADGDHIRFSAPADLDVSPLTELVGPTQQIRPGRFEVVAPADPANVGAVVNWLTARNITPEQLEAGRTSLEARFHELTGRPAAGESAGPSPDGES